MVYKKTSTDDESLNSIVSFEQKNLHIRMHRISRYDDESETYEHCYVFFSSNQQSGKEENSKATAANKDIYCDDLNILASRKEEAATSVIPQLRFQL